MKVTHLNAVIFAAFVAFASRAQALQIFPQDSRHFVVLVLEDSLWHLDSFVEDEAGFPVRIEHQVYSNRASAEKAAHTQGWQLQVSHSLHQQEISLPRQKDFLWQVRESWSSEWENRFADWIRENATVDFFQKYKVPVDCADAAYAFRWIFARIHGLPAANRLTNGRLMSQDSASQQLKKLPQSPVWHEDRRFLKALDILLEATYTHTLMQDSYPIQINPQSLREGAYHLNLFGSTGHTMIFNRVNSEGATDVPLRLIWATVPRDLSLLTEGGFWEATLPTPGMTGILRSRWPIAKGADWQLQAAESHPTFSLEQFADDFIGEEGTFPLAVMKRIAPDFDPLALYFNGRDQLLRSWLNRVQVVRDGFAACQIQDCRPGTSGYEAWSTPTRDGRIRSLLEQLDKYVIDIFNYSFEPYENWLSSLMGQALEIESERVKINLLRTLWYSQSFSVDPRDSIAQRWGIEASAFARQLADKVSALLEARGERVEQNPCTGGLCQPQTPKWSQWQTEELDQEVQLQLLSLTSYCRSQSVQACEDASQMLMGQPGREGRSVYDLLLRSLFFHFDPNSSIQERWAEHPTYEQTQLVTGLRFLAEDSRGQLALEDRLGGRILNAKGEVQHRFVEADRLVYLFPRGGVVLLRRGPELYSLWSAETGYSEPFALKGEVRSLGPQVFAIGRALLVESQGEIRRIGPFLPSFAEHEFPITDGLFLQDDRQLYFLNLNRAQLQLLPITIDSLPNSQQVRIMNFRQSETHLFVSLVIDGELQNYVVDQRTGEKKAYLNECGPVWLTGDDGVLCLTEEEVEPINWLRLDASFSLLESRRLPGVPLNSPSPGLQTLLSSRGGKIYWTDLRDWKSQSRPMMTIEAPYLTEGQDFSLLVDVLETRTWLIDNQTGEPRAYPDYGWRMATDGYEGYVLANPRSLIYEWIWPTQVEWPSYQGLLIPLVQGNHQIDPVTLLGVLNSHSYLTFDSSDPAIYHLKGPRLYRLHSDAHLLLFQAQ